MDLNDPRIYTHVISTLILPENRQNNQRRQLQTLHEHTVSVVFSIHSPGSKLRKFQVRVLPFILMPPEITLVKKNINVVAIHSE